MKNWNVFDNGKLFPWSYSLNTPFQKVLSLGQSLVFAIEILGLEPFILLQVAHLRNHTVILCEYKTCL